MHGALNIYENKNYLHSSLDESFEPSYSIIGQCLSNKNESATVPFFTCFCQLNKALDTDGREDRIRYETRVLTSVLEGVDERARDPAGYATPQQGVLPHPPIHHAEVRLMNDYLLVFFFYNKNIFTMVGEAMRSDLCVYGQWA